MNIAAKAASHIAKELVSVHHIAVHEPGSSHPSLCQDFNHEWLMGTWEVVWSTLPMWKKDSHGHVSFDDVVSSRKQSDSANSKPSTVEGVDTQTGKPNNATFDWRGHKLLKVASSHWEVLGYGEDPDRSLQWVVTFFSKTMFTPAGIDIYLRTTPGKSGTGSGSRRAVLETIVTKLSSNPSEEIRSMVHDGFEIPGSM